MSINDEYIILALFSMIVTENVFLFSIATCHQPSRITGANYEILADF